MRISFFLLFTIGFFLVGCGTSHDKYDLATEQVKREGTARQRTTAFDEEKLAKEGKVGEVTIKKGEKGPDGKIATEDTTMKTFSGPTGSELQWTAPKNAKK